MLSVLLVQRASATRRCFHCPTCKAEVTRTVSARADSASATRAPSRLIIRPEEGRRGPPHHKPRQRSWMVSCAHQSGEVYLTSRDLGIVTRLSGR
jgi:hypothetical protein